MALRRTHGYVRYAISCQYHGGSFLGFSFQGHQNEDTILLNKNKTDLRGYRSVESRIRQALDDLFPTTTKKDNDDSSLLNLPNPNLPNWENIQVSSRTDRGVHAIKNTFHVDILQQQQQQQQDDDNDDDEEQSSKMMISRIHKGLNYHLARQKHSYWQQNCDHHDHDHHENDHEGSKGSRNNNNNNRRKRRRRGAGSSSNSNQKNRGIPKNYNYMGDTYWNRYSANDELRILSVAEAPDYMENDYASKEGNSQPSIVDWNARYSATERTYVYRILCYSNNLDYSSNFGIPFEWDRSWRIQCNYSDGNKNNFLNIDAMKQAAIYLEGTHDFTSFRAAKCQRSSPVVTIKQIQIDSYPYQTMMLLGGEGGGTAGTTTTGGNRYSGSGSDSSSHHHHIPQLVTIQIVGNSFLYRQVRNMVGCLVDVGLNKLNPIQVQNLLQSKNRKLTPYSMAPPHGLYLVDVKHGNFHF